VEEASGTSEAWAAAEAGARAAAEAASVEETMPAEETRAAEEVRAAAEMRAAEAEKRAVRAAAAEARAARAAAAEARAARAAAAEARAARAAAAETGAGRVGEEEAPCGEARVEEDTKASAGWTVRLHEEEALVRVDAAVPRGNRGADPMSTSDVLESHAQDGWREVSDALHNESSAPAGHPEAECVPIGASADPSPTAEPNAGQQVAVVGAHAEEEEDDRAVASLIEATGTREATRLRQLSLPELKTRANDLGIFSPDGNTRHKKTWVQAILIYYEVSNASDAAVAAAQRDAQYSWHHPTSAETVGRSLATGTAAYHTAVSVLEREGWARADVEEAMRLARNDPEMARAMLSHSQIAAKVTSTETTGALSAVSAVGSAIGSAGSAIESAIAAPFQIMAATIQELGGGGRASEGAVGGWGAPAELTPQTERSHWEASGSAEHAESCAEARVQQEQASLDAVRRHMAEEAVAQQQERYDHLVRELRLTPRGVNLALRAQNALHPERVSTSDAEVDDAIDEAIGLTLWAEDRSTRQEIDELALYGTRGVDGHRPHYSCIRCSQPFYTVFGRGRHEADQYCRGWLEEGRVWSRAWHRRAVRQAVTSARPQYAGNRFESLGRF